ncbi:MAG TPA: hypothetical protein EYQ14_04135 [Gammaproteobacteria bacterium]|nr:hypothetical protein [Gammaproteobacteria bacterium]HIL98023.1 hypothetical protein [Pseudomonadales bacterium]
MTIPEAGIHRGKGCRNFRYSGCAEDAMQTVLDFRDKRTAILALGYGDAQCAARHIRAPRSIPTLYYLYYARLSGQIGFSTTFDPFFGKVAIVIKFKYNLFSRPPL